MKDARGEIDMAGVNGGGMREGIHREARGWFLNTKMTERDMGSWPWVAAMLGMEDWMRKKIRSYALENSGILGRASDVKRRIWRA